MKNVDQDSQVLVYQEQYSNFNAMYDRTIYILNSINRNVLGNLFSGMAQMFLIEKMEWFTKF
jgi:hypothetical protein